MTLATEMSSNINAYYNSRWGGVSRRRYNETRRKAQQLRCFGERAVSALAGSSRTMREPAGPVGKFLTT